MQKKILLTKHRDIPTLIYLWKWKVATTAAIYYKFYKGLDTFTAYNRLRQLMQFGFVERKTKLDGRHAVWCLSKKGFECIREYYPPLRENGYKSENIEHDLICSSIHQGEYFLNQPRNVKIISEQQLRRYEEEVLPNYLPSGDIHRPDGYWCFEEDDLGFDETKHFVVALEFERTQKSSSRLDKTANFYADLDSSYRVLWVVDGESHLRKVRERMMKANFGSDIHNYCLFKDYKKLGWQCQVLSGPEKGLSVSDFFVSKASTLTKQGPNNCLALKILDTKIRYQNSTKIVKNKLIEKY